jgi:hypothetical protein
MEIINWMNSHIPKGASIYINFDKRDFILHTDLKVAQATDFMAIEHGRIKNPLPLREDPTYIPINKVSWILWNKTADKAARQKMTWLTPDYVSLKRIPEDEFNLVFSNKRYDVYKNKFIQE